MDKSLKRHDSLPPMQDDQTMSNNQMGTRVEKGYDVNMTKSNQSQDQDLNYNMNSRSVDANFTVGKEKFAIHFSNENVEGDETICIESELFRVEDGCMEEITDAEIVAFLKKAGIENAKSNNWDGEASMQRWVYGDILCCAIEWVEEKYGRQCSLGVSLGIYPEEIYQFLELEY